MAGTHGRQSNLERAAAPLLAHAGPRLARVSPVRRPVVALIEAWMRRDSAKIQVTSGLPPGVCDDRAAMRLALLRTIQRAMKDNVFLRQKQYGTSLRQALAAAEEWLAQQQEDEEGPVE